MDKFEFEMLKSIEKDGSVILSLLPVGIIIIIAFLFICL